MHERAKVQLEHAYLLHRRDFRETSLLLEFFTRSHGRVALIGKGIRRSKRTSAAVLWPFMPLLISWTGRGELPILSTAEHGIGSAVTEPEALVCGLYLNELLLRLLAARDPHPDVFELYEATLSALVGCDDREVWLRRFELRFLDALGYALPLDGDVDNGRMIEAGKFYSVQPDHGPVETTPRPGAVRGATLLALRSGFFSSPSERAEAKLLMRRIIAHHLGGRPLRSRELFRAGRV